MYAEKQQLAGKNFKRQLRADGIVETPAKDNATITEQLIDCVIALITIGSGDSVFSNRPLRPVAKAG